MNELVSVLPESTTGTIRYVVQTVDYVRLARGCVRGCTVNIQSKYLIRKLHR
jgi:hypothetical protein